MRLAFPAALLALCASSVASAQAPQLPGAIAFASNRAPNIWAADLMVSAPRAKTVNVTRSLGIADRDADLSPDGREVVFSRRDAGGEDLFALTLPARRLARLTFTPRQYESNPVYSPRGDAVAFVRGTLHNDDAVWIVDHAGERRLTQDGGFISGLAWSPDGTQLTFSEASTGVFVIGRGGAGLRRVAHRHDFVPIDWLPAGIAILPSPQNGVQLLALDPKSGRTRRISNPCGVGAPTFSTDRTHVVCEARRGTHVHVRSRSGRPVRAIRIQLRGEHAQVNRFALGPLGRTLVFDSMVETRHTDVWLLGRRLERLTANHFDDASPALSPDRRRVAFVRSPFVGGQTSSEKPLMTVDVRTHRVRPICGLRGTSPSWSRDSGSIAFARAGDIHVVDIGRCRVRRLTRGPALDTGPAWSRDGRAIAFVRLREIVRSVHVVPAAGGVPRQVPATRDADDLAWSPDGRSIAYSTGEAIRLLSLDTGETRELVRDPVNRPSSPTWSPDGGRIAYSAGWQFLPSREGVHNLELRTVDMATGEITRLVSGSGLHYAPNWR